MDTARYGQVATPFVRCLPPEQSAEQPTAWRIAAPGRFREPVFGAAWQRRLESRLATGDYRARLLPYFVRV